MWYLQESNQGHTDFQSVALPTELRYLLSASKIDSICYSQNYFIKCFCKFEVLQDCMNLVVDIGNNFFKLGIFENSNLVFSFFDKNDKIDVEIEKLFVVTAK